ncbi:aldo/keto reductase [Candidatus Caldarchaeum subterraneum]|uniref:Aldo/keto reductase n=1 Tax=Caldiarchaeum subterraneum TaxID=311458 RepID=E6N8R0_CALS0|nr:aldo/keto reductase [Candidatus Caldarchaeum subterraneum]BAJ49713.1 aldo/keto reductase [Candidatus Caldarchaeum subterraneum]BAJ51382.1 aldo/keto reductase [Candidatus Caldarchaeum subterraneum]
MLYTELGRTGEKVSVVWLGTWQFGSGSWGFGKGYGEKECLEAVYASVEAGVNVIDTAEVYGGGVSEKIVGKAVKELGDRVLIATKVAPHHLTYNGVIEACERSLNRLGVKTIDLYQIHFPNPLIPITQTMRAMEHLVKTGKIRYIGVSNFSLGQLIKARQALRSEDIVSNQVRYNLLQRQPEEHLLPYCIREKINILAYSPLAQGLLTGKYTSTNPPRDIIRRINPLYTRRYLKRIEPLLTELRNLAEKYGASVGQIALAWVFAHEGCVAIAGSKNREQALNNAAAGNIQLTRDEMEKLTALSMQTQPGAMEIIQTIPRILGF